MAGNTADDPVIVATWAEMTAAMALNTKYIKWAERENKYIAQVDISAQVTGSCTQIDFNGWTIGTLNITQVQANNVFPGLWYAINLTINHLNYYKSAKPCNRIFYRIVNCYFYDIFYESQDTEYTDFNFKGNAYIANQAFNSILNMRSQDYAPRYPVNKAKNCNIKIDYKWTKNGTTNYYLLWCDYNHGGYSDIYLTQYDNCYIYGTIDLSEGEGEWQWSQIKNSSVNYQIRADACIFNIKTLISENCTFGGLRIYANAPTGTVSSYRNVPDKTLFVIDNGNSAIQYDASITSIPYCVLHTMTGDIPANVIRSYGESIRGETWLTNRYWNYVHDDDYREDKITDFVGTASADVPTFERWTWRKSDYINDTVPFLPFFDMPIYEPPVIYPIERVERISVYDIYEPQSGYDHNGVAILFPSEVTSYKEDMGRWDINLKHPIDPYGKWTYIIGQNCIKVNGQIFRIDETEIYCDANQQYITAHANHITYDLNDAFIGDATFEVSSGNAFEYEIIQASKTLIPTQQPTPYEYSFELTSDITGQLVGDFHDQTVTGALYGDDNSFANRYGGHLYRDNFHLSINTVQENLPAAPAFQIRYGTDMTKISYKIDFSSWLTELICEDNYGDLWGIAYTGSEWIIHHNKTKRIHFTYPPETPDPMACLEADGFNYWQTVNTPKVSIEVSVANIKSDPKYKDFLNLQNMDVGYTGTVYFEQMGIDVDLKIVSIKRNELTGEAIQITLGNAPNSFIRSPVCSQTIVPNGSVEAKQAQTIKDMQTEIENVKLKSMKYWNGMKNYTWADVKKYKWEEIKNGELNN